MKVPVLSVIKYSQKITLTRHFPHNGQILVKVGEVVTPITRLAAAKVSFLRQDLSFDGRLLVKTADWVKGGQVLSKTGFFGGENLIAPFAGVVETINVQDQTLTLASPPRDFFLVAGCEGQIMEILEGNLIKIQTDATTVRGVLGLNNGFGELILDTQMKEEESVGKIILTKYLNKVLFSKAKTLGVAGIIAGSLDWENFLEIRRLAIGLVILEGFGVTVSEDQNNSAFKVLESKLGKFVALEGQNSEVLVPELPSRDKPAVLPLLAELTAGAYVKIFGWPYFNAVGTVTEVLSGGHTFDSGLTAPAARVKLLSNSKEVVVPIETLGVLVN